MAKAIRALIVVWALLAAGLSAGCAGPVRVMSFNIRMATAADGVNQWALRADRVVDTIRADQPDLLGMQEVLAEQADYLREALPEYGFVGVGRADGGRAGEMMAIMYRTSKFELLDQGHMWLSETPNEVGSKGWDAACERMVTWVKLRSRRVKDRASRDTADQKTRGANGRAFYVFNTHFDHVGATARLASARLIRGLVDEHAEWPVIVTGDFNCGPGSKPYEVLIANGPLRDTYVASGGREESAGTFNGFKGMRDGARIDWILVNDRFAVVDAGIDRRSYEAGGETRYPSDHFPVTAAVKLR